MLTNEELDAFFSLEPIGAAPKIDFVEAPGDEEPPVQDDEASALLAGTERPAWLKAQIADLADIVQALDLRARAGHAHTTIGDELARLRQFTRTLAFVAAPPPRGHQQFDLADFVEEQLGEIAGRTPDAPRLLFKRGGDASTDVEADKSLIALALDALLQTAVACAGSGDVVRVSVRGDFLDDGRLVVARIEFPRGPLLALAPDEILRPYALRSVLPTIGPNAIAAAGAISVGQGGDLVVEEVSTSVSASSLAFVLQLHQGVRGDDLPDAVNETETADLGPRSEGEGDPTTTAALDD